MAIRTCLPPSVVSMSISNARIVFFSCTSALLFAWPLVPVFAQSRSATAAVPPNIQDDDLRNQFDFEEVFTSVFDDPTVISPDTKLWRRESMVGSNNSGQHRQAKSRRHAAWYDKYHEETAFIRDGVLIQRGFVADKNLPGFTSRDAGNSPRNHEYIDPDPREKGKGRVNFADFELHTSWLDTFAVKSVDGVQVPVERDDVVVLKREYWGQSGKSDTGSPNITFSPGTFFEIEVNFERMDAIAHRHSFWLMPSNSSHLAYDDDPKNGLEIDIYEHEIALEKSEVVGPEPSINDILLMKCIGGQTTPQSTRNEMREDGNTAIRSPRINVGWHKIGLLWTKDQLVWLVDGKPVVKDTVLVPQVKMFLILSREANTGAKQSDSKSGHELAADRSRIPQDAGLFGRNVATPANRELIKQGKDEVQVRAVRAWKVRANRK